MSFTHLAARTSALMDRSMHFRSWTIQEKDSWPVRRVRVNFFDRHGRIVVTVHCRSLKAPSCSTAVFHIDFHDPLCFHSFRIRPTAADYSPTSTTSGVLIQLSPPGSRRVTWAFQCFAARRAGLAEHRLIDPRARRG